MGVAYPYGSRYIVNRPVHNVTPLPRSPMSSTAPRYVTYLRVSTARQGESGLGLDAQRETVEAFARQNGGEIVGQYVEVESGKRVDRPELAKALAAAKKAKAVLVVAKLDRLARNLLFVERLRESGVEFLACDQPFASKLTVQILCAVAEDEARRISERTKAALAAARRRGVKLGSPVAAETAAMARAARSAYASKANETTRAVIRDIQRAGVSTLAGIASALEARGVRTPRGNTTWQPTQVARLVAGSVGI